MADDPKSRELAALMKHAQPKIKPWFHVDFDETDLTLRLWHGSELVGELKPKEGNADEIQSGDPSVVPFTRQEEKAIQEARWHGWVTSETIIQMIAMWPEGGGEHG